MASEMTSVFARNESCPVREISDGLVIMAPAGEATHSLEAIGAFIWRQLDGQQDLGSVLAAITGQYDVENSVAEADLQEFVSVLLAANIIVQVS